MKDLNETAEDNLNEIEDESAKVARTTQEFRNKFWQSKKHETPKNSNSKCF